MSISNVNWKNYPPSENVVLFLEWGNYVTFHADNQFRECFHKCDGIRKNIEDIQFYFQFKKVADINLISPELVQVWKDYFLLNSIHSGVTECTCNLRDKVSPTVLPHLDFYSLDISRNQLGIKKRASL